MDKGRLKLINNTFLPFGGQGDIMVIITLQRDKCIGCNYCAEFAPEYFRMSKKDGKSVLLKSTDKKGFFTLKTPIPDAFEPCDKAAKACPVKIISVKEV